MPSASSEHCNAAYLTGVAGGRRVACCHDCNRRGRRHSLRLGSPGSRSAPAQRHSRSSGPILHVHIRGALPPTAYVAKAFQITAATEFPPTSHQCPEEKHCPNNCLPALPASCHKARLPAKAGCTPHLLLLDTWKVGHVQAPEHVVCVGVHLHSIKLVGARCNLLRDSQGCELRRQMAVHRT